MALAKREVLNLQREGKTFSVADPIWKPSAVPRRPLWPHDATRRRAGRSGPLTVEWIHMESSLNCAADSDDDLTSLMTSNTFPWDLSDSEEYSEIGRDSGSEEARIDIDRSCRLVLSFCLCRSWK